MLERITKNGVIYSQWIVGAYNNDDNNKNEFYIIYNNDKKNTTKPIKNIFTIEITDYFTTWLFLFFCVYKFCS